MTTMVKNMFFGDLYLFIDREVFRLKRGKSYLSYEELKVLTGNLRNNLRKLCGRVPKQIEIACQFAEALMAPSKSETIKKLKDISCLCGGVGGIALMIAGIGAALGWGAGVIAIVVSLFTSVNLVPIIGQIAGGVALLGIAAYFYVHQESPESISEKSINMLKLQIQKIEDILWEDCGKDIKRNFKHTKLLKS